MKLEQKSLVVRPFIKKIKGCSVLGVWVLKSTLGKPFPSILLFPVVKMFLDGQAVYKIINIETLEDNLFYLSQ